jgi:hypothetical protein
MKYKLFNSVVNLSEAKDWESAKKEWKLQRISYGIETCLCGHHPIIERCYMRNIINNNLILIGNCCLKQFDLGRNFDKTFSAISQKRINEDLINYSWEKGLINNSEKKFLIDIWRKRKLTVKQESWFNALKKRIIKWCENGNN